MQSVDQIPGTLIGENVPTMPSINSIFFSVIIFILETEMRVFSLSLGVEFPIV